jgi:regulator of nucleoside diphosphate kinase
MALTTPDARLRVLNRDAARIGAIRTRAVASLQRKEIDKVNETIVTQNDLERLRVLLTRLHNWGDIPPEHLRDLEDRLKAAKVIESADLPRSVVTMNSLVGLRDVDLDEKFSCTLSYPEEADVVKHKVSVTVPLGNRMLGAREGDTIDCPVPSGNRTLRVERVYYQPEAAGDLHL